MPHQQGLCHAAARCQIPFMQGISPMVSLLQDATVAGLMLPMEGPEALRDLEVPKF